MYFTHYTFARGITSLGPGDKGQTGAQGRTGPKGSTGITEPGPPGPAGLGAENPPIQEFQSGLRCIGSQYCNGTTQPTQIFIGNLTLHFKQEFLISRGVF